MNHLLPSKEFIEGVRRDIETTHPDEPHIREVLYQMAEHTFGVDIRQPVEKVERYG